MAPTDLFSRHGQRAVPILLVILALLLLAARITHHVMQRNAPAGADLVRWVTVERASDMAVRSGIPIMIDFTADCAPCQELDAMVFRDPSLAAEINDRFISVRIVDRQKEDGRNSPEVEALQQRYSVKEYPTVVFIHPNGVQIATMEGFRGKGAFLRVMERAR